MFKMPNYWASAEIQYPNSEVVIHQFHSKSSICNAEILREWSVLGNSMNETFRTIAKGVGTIVLIRLKCMPERLNILRLNKYPLSWGGNVNK